MLKLPIFSRPDRHLTSAYTVRTVHRHVDWASTNLLGLLIDPIAAVALVAMVIGLVAGRLARERFPTPPKVIVSGVVITLAR